MSKKEKKKKLEKTLNKLERNNRLGIASNIFTTMSSLKDTITRSEVSGKSPKFFYYTAKGKMKEYEVNKNTKIAFQVSDDISVICKLVSGTSSVDDTLQPDGKGGVQYEGASTDQTNIYNMYIVSFQDFFDSLRREMLGDKSLTYFYTKGPKSDEEHHVLGVCEKHGSILDKDGKVIVDIRFDL